MPGPWLDESWADATRYGVRADRILHESRSEFQEIRVLENSALGRVLMLDGIFQTSEADEAYYHEMLVHPALACVAAPRRVLVIGGGDGGTAREVLRHPGVEACVMVEIDAEVVDVCKRLMPSLGEGVWEDPRLELHLEDGVAYAAAAAEASFDAVILDGSDPVGPSEGLFGEEFYRSCLRLLRPGGIFALQSESFFLTDELFFDIQASLRRVFPEVHPCVGGVPLYACGFWTWTLCSRDRGPEDLDEERAGAVAEASKVWDAAVHRAAFVLPVEVRRRLEA